MMWCAHVELACSVKCSRLLLTHCGPSWSGLYKPLDFKKPCIKENLMETAHVSQPQSGSMENVREVSRKLSSRFEELSPGVFLTGAAASIALSFVLRITGRQHDAQFVGQWAPTLLLFGL